MRVLTYVLVYAVLIAITLAEVYLVTAPLQLSYFVLVSSLIGLAFVKAVMIALFFQHLIAEPRPLSAFELFGLAGVIILLFMSTQSIIGVIHTHYTT
jgi:cytochrome c oxidase subunit 4